MVTKIDLAIDLNGTTLADLLSHKTLSLARNFSFGTFENSVPTTEYHDPDTKEVTIYSSRGTIVESILIPDMYDVKLYTTACDSSQLINGKEDDYFNAIRMVDRETYAVITISYINTSNCQIVIDSYTISSDRYKKFKSNLIKYKMFYGDSLCTKYY
jgi:hypothetical protein